MKYLMLLIASFYLLPAFSQKSKVYVSVTGAVYAVENTELKAGANAGVGYLIDDKFGAGITADVWPGEDNSTYGVIAADFRYLFTGISKTVTPFITAQPGSVIYNRTFKVLNQEVTQRGSFSFNAMAGVMHRPQKGIGITFSVGYSTIGFTVKDTESRSNGFRANVGIIF